METTYYDFAAAETWSRYTDFTDASGARTAQRFWRDNGNVETTYFDAHNQNSWAFYTDTHDANGNFLGRTGQYDDGTLF